MLGQFPELTSVQWVFPNPFPRAGDSDHSTACHVTCTPPPVVLQGAAAHCVAIMLIGVVLSLSQTVTSKLAEMARSYCIPVCNIKTMLSPVPKLQKGGPQSPLLFPPKMQQNIHGVLAQTQQTRPWTCRDAYAHMRPGKGPPQSLTHLVRLPQIPRNLSVTAKVEVPQRHATSVVK